MLERWVMRIILMFSLLMSSLRVVMVEVPECVITPLVPMCLIVGLLSLPLAFPFFPFPEAEIVTNPGGSSHLFGFPPPFPSGRYKIPGRE